MVSKLDDRMIERERSLKGNLLFRMLRRKGNYGLHDEKRTLERTCAAAYTSAYFKCVSRNKQVGMKRAT